MDPSEKFEEYEGRPAEGSTVVETEVDDLEITLAILEATVEPVRTNC